MLSELDSKNHLRSLLYGFHLLNVDVPIMFLCRCAHSNSDLRSWRERQKMNLLN